MCNKVQGLGDLCIGPTTMTTMPDRTAKAGLVERRTGVKKQRSGT
jgi:DNA-binding MarR family transcriptional regulator